MSLNNRGNKKLFSISLNNINNLLISLLTFLILIVSTAPSFAADTVPHLINYQGKLNDATGEPLLTGEYKLEFNIYDDPNAGNRIWGPQVFDNTPVVRGFFNVPLGPKDANNLDITGC
jgi:hypothetical protein